MAHLIKFIKPSKDITDLIRKLMSSIISTQENSNTSLVEAIKK